jgi:hypothetical protein
MSKAEQAAGRENLAHVAIRPCRANGRFFGLDMGDWSILLGGGFALAGVFAKRDAAVPTIVTVATEVEIQTRAADANRNHVRADLESS